VPKRPPSSIAASAAPDTRTRILAAALEAFAEHGFGSATTSEIARRAGVAEKTLFAHFKTKDALFDQTLTPATIDLLIPEVLSPVAPDQRQGGGSLETFLENLVRNRLQIIRKHPTKFKLIVQELLLRPDRARQLVGGRDDGITPVLEKVLGDLRQRGEIRDVPASLVLRMYAYVLLGYAVQAVLFDPGAALDDESEIARMVNVLVEGLRPRPKTAAPQPRAGAGSTASKRRKR